MQQKPLISFYIPTHNRSNYLHDTILSAIQQDGFDPHNMEIIVCDDASTDNTKDIVLLLQKKYPCIHYIRNDANLGIDGNILKAFDVCIGKYIWLMGDDDIIYPDRMSIVIDIIKQHQDIYVFHLNYDTYSQDMQTCKQIKRLGDKKTAFFSCLADLYAYGDYGLGLITYMGCVFRNDINRDISIPLTYFPHTCLSHILHNKPMCFIGDSIIQYRTNNSDFSTAQNWKGIYSHRKIWIIGYMKFILFSYKHKTQVDHMRLAMSYIFIIKRFVVLVCALGARKLGLYQKLLPRRRKSKFNIFNS